MCDLKRVSDRCIISTFQAKPDGRAQPSGLSLLPEYRSSACSIPAKMCEQSRCRDSRGNSEDEEAQKLNNHWTEKCLPESALSLVANVRSNYNQNVKLFGEIKEVKG